ATPHRLLAPDLTDAEVAAPAHGSHDGQAGELLAVVLAGADVPRHHGLAAHRFRLAAHDAAACEDLGRAGFDIIANDGAAGKRRSGRQHERRCENCALHGDLLNRMPELKLGPTYVKEYCTRRPKISSSHAL